MNIFKKFVSKMDDGFIRLILFSLFWLIFIIYAIFNENMKFWNFLYYCILYVPFTYLLLKKSFYYANILIIVLSVVEIISSTAIIIKCVTEFEVAYVFTIIYSLINFFFFSLLIIYILLKLKNREFNEDKNIYLGLIVAIFFSVKLIIGIINLIFIIQTSNNILIDLLGFLYNIVLVMFEVLFVITVNKEHKLVQRYE